ncbi:MAG TPA: class E sortase [Candidatus Saccharimonadales bacterium]
MPDKKTDADVATDLIRSKISDIYKTEPDAKLEAAEVKIISPTSKHQEFMRQLINSGKSIATIQTEWHKYYVSLPDDEKKVVWEEFYASNQVLSRNLKSVTPSQDLAKLKNQVTTANHYQPKTKTDQTKASKISRTIKNKVTANGQLKAKHHVQSLLFGLGLGAVIIIIFLFSFFNEIIIAPFIQPSRTASATPIIIGSDSVAIASSPQVIIPKINVQIPVDYSVTTTDEATIENDLEAGVVHYPTTVLPGQNGNSAFFGHSSNNIFNPGKYKFAFVLLHTIVNGDTFYLSYNHTVYIYKVISTTVVSPNDVGVLGPVSGQTATATLITCDPPGTSINRLVVVGQQISPNPNTNTTAEASIATSTGPTSLPGNGPSLWSRFIDSTEGKVVLTGLVIAIVVIGFRKLSKSRA